MSQLPGLAEPGGTSFGVLIESDGPEIVIERATYMDFGGIVWAAGHASLGTPLRVRRFSGSGDDSGVVS